MPEFSLHIYRALLVALRKAGYRFMTVEQYVSAPPEVAERVAVMRHDVDKLPLNSLCMAQLEKREGVAATYYFRCVPESYDERCIRDIAALGHEIGYHYEDMSIAGGDVEKAYAHFCEVLGKLRNFYPVRTICMHGAPTSRWDGRDLWKSYDYHELGIIAEPYFDIDYANTFYLTDTGRCWDGFKVSVRDKIPQYQDLWTARGLVFHTTGDILRAIENDKLPRRVLFTTHPQRWSDDFWQRQLELVSQTAKNIIKRIIIETNRR